MKKYNDGRGWFFCSHRHSLSARGIKNAPINYAKMIEISSDDIRKHSIEDIKKQLVKKLKKGQAEDSVVPLYAKDDLDLYYGLTDAKPHNFDFSEGYGEKWDIALDLTDEEQENEDFAPMMNYVYPLPSQFTSDMEDKFGSDWRKKIKSELNNTTVVTMLDSDEHYLALTGGGMDFSWEIAESYINLGYAPPAHFCDLPRMAGRGTSAKDKRIIRACQMSLKAEADKHGSALERSKEDYGKKIDYAYAPAFVAGDLPLIAGEGLGVAGATAVSLVPLAVIAGGGYLAIKGGKKIADSVSGKKTKKSSKNKRKATDFSKSSLSENQKDMVKTLKRGSMYVKGRDIVTARALKDKGLVTLHDDEDVWKGGYRYEVRLK